MAFRIRQPHVILNEDKHPMCVIKPGTGFKERLIHALQSEFDSIKSHVQ